MKKPIYFDYNATTPCDPRVIKAMEPMWSDNFGNTASQLHSYGWRAEGAVEKARKQIADLLHCSANELTFTSGATEANNWVLYGLFTKLKEQHPKGKHHFLASTIEHSSVINALKSLKQFFDAEVDFVEVDSQGFLNFEDLQKKVKPHTRLFSLIHINNEVGTIQDLKRVIDFCHSKNILLHTDATQTIGKYPFSIKEYPVDFLTCSAHKFYGPKGVGFLYRSKATTTEINPLLFGGGHEKGQRSGTLNVPAIVGAGAAAEIAKNEMEKDFSHVLNLRNDFFKQLQAKLPFLKVNGPEISLSDKTEFSLKNSKRAANNLNLQFYPIKTESVVQSLGNLAFSPGSACQSENMSISHVLKGIGCSDLAAQCSIRFSLGRWTSKEDIDKAVDLLTAVYTDQEHLKRAQVVL